MSFSEKTLGLCVPLYGYFVLSLAYLTRLQTARTGPQKAPWVWLDWQYAVPTLWAHLEPATII